MKRNLIRTAALAVAATAAAVSLSSCAAIDRMRQRQAIDGGDGTLTVDGVKYRELIESDTVGLTDNKYYIDYFDYDYYDYDDNEVYVTDPEVPVLLAGGYYRDTASISKDRISISRWNTVYIREDRFDEYSEILRDADFKSYGTYVFVCDDNAVCRNEFRVFSPEVSDALLAAFSGEAETRPSDMYSESFYDIYPCDSTGIFFREAGVCELMCCSDGRWLVCSYDNYDAVYPVSDDVSAALSEFFRQSESAENEYLTQ